MSRQVLFCRAEGDSFPIDQFLHDSNTQQLIVPEIHNVGTPHYRITGDPVGGRDIPPIPLSRHIAALLKAAQNLQGAKLQELVTFAQDMDKAQQ